MGNAVFFLLSYVVAVPERQEGAFVATSGSFPVDRNNDFSPRLCPMVRAVAGAEHALGCELRQHSYDGLKPKASEHEHRGIGRVGNDFRRGKEENRQGNEVWQLPVTVP